MAYQNTLFQLLPKHLQHKVVQLFLLNFDINIHLLICKIQLFNQSGTCSWHQK